MRAVPVRAAISRVTVSGMTMRLHARVAAERTTAALTNRELWQPALLFLSFYGGQPGPNQRPVNRTLLHLYWRLRWFTAFGHCNRFLDLVLDDGLGGDVDGHGGDHRFRDDWRRGDFGVI